MTVHVQARMDPMYTDRRQLLVIAIAVLVCRCQQASTPSVSKSEEEWHRYDDPRYSADQRLAVRKATQAILDSNPSEPRPDFDQAFRYEVWEDADSWSVDVWFVNGFKDGKPQFWPDGDCDVVLNRDFSVRSVGLQTLSKTKRTSTTTR
jgi:hypothetical protein